MTCVQCKEKEPMINDDLCTTCSSDNYFREMSFTEELPDFEYCNACHKLAHKDNKLCPEFAELCDICNTPTINYAIGAEFWNCLCATCWDKEKDLI